MYILIGVKVLTRFLEEEVFMPKDSQPDNKQARMEKADGQTPITKENQNKNKNAKRKSIKQNDV
jgi:hypothetical protein